MIISPKKTIIKRFEEETNSMLMEDYMFFNYTHRLILTWIYSNPNPPLLSPIPNINLSFSKTHQYYNNNNNNSSRNICSSTSTLNEIEQYVKQSTTQWENVISFFYNQYCKRATKQSTSSSSLLSQQSSIKDSYNCLLISCIYYADLFVRKQHPQSNSSYSTSMRLSILDILVISICLTIKFWMEEKMSVNKYLSDIYGISLKRINEMEIYFLEVINYQLYLEDKDIKQFSNMIYKCQQNNNLNNNSYSKQNNLQAESAFNSIFNNNNNNNNHHQTHIGNINNINNIQTPAPPPIICINQIHCNSYSSPLSSSSNTPIYQSPTVSFHNHNIQYNQNSIDKHLSPCISSSPHNQYQVPSLIPSPISSPLSNKSSYVPKTPCKSSMYSNKSSNKKYIIHSTTNHSNNHNLNIQKSRITYSNSTNTVIRISTKNLLIANALANSNYNNIVPSNVHHHHHNVPTSSTAVVGGNSNNNSVVVVVLPMSI